MSLHYPFPVIHTIEDVLPHIDDNFRVVEKEGLTFINYNQMGADVFPAMKEFPGGPLQSVEDQHHDHMMAQWNERAAVRRECRGITFDSRSGEIVSRPFHKFFNAGEREDVSLDKIDVSRPHHLLEKLDGSMIRPLYLGGGFRWGTKMGVTDVGMLAEEFVAGSKAGYIDLAGYCRRLGMTPLFEFGSRRSRIVVDFPEDVMVLLAVRATVPGVYLPRSYVRSLGHRFGVPVVDHVDARGMFFSDNAVAVSDLQKSMDTIRADEDGEGKIMVFADGHAVKIKSDRYVRVHRAKDMMRSEMRLLDLVFNEELDDLMAALLPEDRSRIEMYLASYAEAFSDLKDRIDVTYRHVRSSYETKKDFATSHYARETLSSTWKSIMFALWDGKSESTSDAAIKVIRNSMSSETKFADMKSVMKFSTGWDDVWSTNMEEAA